MPCSAVISNRRIRDRLNPDAYLRLQFDVSVTSSRIDGACIGRTSITGGRDRGESTLMHGSNSWMRTTVVLVPLSLVCRYPLIFTIYIFKASHSRCFGWGINISLFFTPFTYTVNFHLSGSLIVPKGEPNITNSLWLHSHPSKPPSKRQSKMASSQEP